MIKSIKIAIYSGEVPSTTFINRLVELLAFNGNVVYLFGKQTARFSPSKNIIVCTYSNKRNKLLLVFKYSLLLYFFKRKDKIKLDKIIRNQFHNKLNYKVKFYPILYYKPDVFHLQWAKTVDEWMWIKEFGMKLILSLRGTHITISPIADDDLNLKYHKFFPEIDAFHAVSNSIKNEALQYNVNESRIKVIYSGYNFDSIPFVDKKQSFITPIKVISVGRSHWLKGYNYALDAFKNLLDQGVNFEYTIIGAHDNEELIYQIEQLGLSNFVKLKKSISNAEVFKAIQMSDVLLLPSVEEGIANVAIESMALGTIVVSSDCGGMCELITHGLNGFVFKKRNPISISKTLIKVVSLQEEERRKIAENAREKVKIQHQQNKMIKDFQELYTIVLE
jgi:glycosyltransferase involved in cell wall biosynthesis